MTAYHGSNIEIDKVDLKLCRKYTDFGKGFYLTTSESQAFLRAQSKASAFGGMPIVTKWEIDINDEDFKQLKIKKFDSENEEWAEFIYRSRELGEENDFDIVIGPIADDNMRYLLRAVRIGQLSIKDFVEKLRYKEFTEQICLRSDKAIKFLIKL